MFIFYSFTHFLIGYVVGFFLGKNKCGAVTGEREREREREVCR
jgi:hypothetical protein